MKAVGQATVGKVYVVRKCREKIADRKKITIVVLDPILADFNKS